MRIYDLEFGKIYRNQGDLFFIAFPKREDVIVRWTRKGMSYSDPVAKAREKYFPMDGYELECTSAELFRLLEPRP